VEIGVEGNGRDGRDGKEGEDGEGIEAGSGLGVDNGDVVVGERAQTV
jgi:hypothetical protein